MISDERLDAFRQDGAMVRVVRDQLEENDVIGIVVAWDTDQVMIRKANRRIVKLSRAHHYELASEERSDPF